MKLYKNSLKRDGVKLKDVFNKKKHPVSASIKEVFPPQTKTSTNQSDCSHPSNSPQTTSEFLSDPQNPTTDRNSPFSSSILESILPAKNPSKFRLNHDSYADQEPEAHQDSFLFNYFKQRELEKLFNGAGGRWWLLTLLFAVLNLHSQLFKWFPLSLQLLISSHYTALILLRTIFFSSNMLGNNEFTIDVTENRDSSYNLILKMDQIGSNNLSISWGFEIKKKHNSKTNKPNSYCPDDLPSRNRIKKSPPNVTISKFLIELNDELIGECLSTETSTAVNGLIPDSIYRIQVHALIESTKTVQISNILVVKTSTEINKSLERNNNIFVSHLMDLKSKIYSLITVDSHNCKKGETVFDLSRHPEISISIDASKPSNRKTNHSAKSSRSSSESISKLEKNSFEKSNKKSSPKTPSLTHIPNVHNENPAENKHKDLDFSINYASKVPFPENCQNLLETDSNFSAKDANLPNGEPSFSCCPIVKTVPQSRSSSFSSDSTIERPDLAKFIDFSNSKDFETNVFMPKHKNESESISTEINCDYLSELIPNSVLDDSKTLQDTSLSEKTSFNNVTDSQAPTSSGTSNYNQPTITYPENNSFSEKSYGWTVQIPKRQKKKGAHNNIQNIVTHNISSDAHQTEKSLDNSVKAVSSKSRKTKQFQKSGQKDTQAITNKYLDNMSFENLQKGISSVNFQNSPESSSLVDPKLNYKDALVLHPNFIKAVKKSPRIFKTEFSTSEIAIKEIKIQENNTLGEIGPKEDLNDHLNSLKGKFSVSRDIVADLNPEKVDKNHQRTKNINCKSTKLYNGANSKSPIIVRDLAKKIKNSKNKSNSDFKKVPGKKLKKSSTDIYSPPERELNPLPKPLTINTNTNYKNTPMNCNPISKSTLGTNKFSSASSISHKPFNSKPSTKIQKENPLFNSIDDQQIDFTNRPNVAEEKKRYSSYNIFDSIPSFNSRISSKSLSGFDLSLNSNRNFDRGLYISENMPNNNFENRSRMLLDFVNDESSADTSKSTLLNFPQKAFSSADPKIDFINEGAGMLSSIIPPFDRNIQDKRYSHHPKPYSRAYPQGNSFSNRGSNLNQAQFRESFDAPSDSNLISFPPTYNDWNSFSTDGIFNDNLKSSAPYPANNSGQNTYPRSSISDPLNFEVSASHPSIGSGSSLDNVLTNNDDDNKFPSNQLYNRPDLFKRNFQKDRLKPFAISSQLWGSPALPPSSPSLSFNSFQQPLKYINPPRVSPIGYRPNLDLNDDSKKDKNIFMPES
ncbi:hypothetical protein AYI68_g8333 [Smittium mucronatum]|uniref:Fibronectin type-III domain-containing protein n=1 Tax=Smittium mucronatum TaxID=133383 RepID=A0A1R0GL73_9FUNG|nr:hypothetical protein AYI68_g8333 [Smittium mucronatum]